MQSYIPPIYEVNSSIYFYECDDPKRLLHTNESLPLIMRYLENRPHILQDYPIQKSLPYMNHKGLTMWDALLPQIEQWTNNPYNLTPETSPYRFPPEFHGLYRVR